MLAHSSSLHRALVLSCVMVVVAIVPAAAVASDAFMHPEGTLRLASRTLVAGSAVEIRGEMFAEHGKLELLLVGVAGRVRLGDVTADSVGGFTHSFEIPGDIDVGAYRLVAIATDEDEVASLNVELLAAAPDADEESEHGGDAGHSGDGEHAEAAEPTDDPLVLDRAGSVLVTGGAVAAIIFAVVAGGLLLRKPEETA